ncbi:MAG: hypothetical protein WA949_07330 [Phormidesmis sp.]
MKKASYKSPLYPCIQVDTAVLGGKRKFLFLAAIALCGECDRTKALPMAI